MKKYNSNVDADISILNLTDKILNTFKDNNILKVGDLWVLNRKKLKDIGINDSDIKQIIIKLQLLGLDLNKKIY